MALSLNQYIKCIESDLRASGNNYVSIIQGSWVTTFIFGPDEKSNHKKVKVKNATLLDGIVTGKTPLTLKKHILCQQTK